LALGLFPTSIINNIFLNECEYKLYFQIKLWLLELLQANYTFTTQGFRENTDLIMSLPQIITLENTALKQSG
jgi:hypothetical protein